MSSSWQSFHTEVFFVAFRQVWQECPYPMCSVLISCHVRSDNWYDLIIIQRALSQGILQNPPGCQQPQILNCLLKTNSASLAVPLKKLVDSTVAGGQYVFSPLYQQILFPSADARWVEKPQVTFVQDFPGLLQWHRQVFFWFVKIEGCQVWPANL